MAQPRPGASASASVQGTIVDPLGALVTGATVTLHAESFPDRIATSDEFGGFRFSAVNPGEYSLFVEANGFRTDQREFRLAANQSLQLKIGLAIEVQRQQIDVSGETLSSAPERNLGAIVLQGSDLDALATDSKTLQLQLEAMAGGNPRTGSQLFLDGFSATRLPPKSSIREIRMNQNPYSAQYDAAGFNRIEVFTRPGGNKLSGSLHLLGEDSALDSRNPFVGRQPAYSAFYSEGDINGPLTKSSSWFLTGDRQDVGAQSFIHAITSSNGPAYTATVSSPQKSTDLGPRFDFQLGKIQTLSLRYQFGRQTQDSLLQSQLSLPSQAIGTRHTDQTLQVSDTQVYSPHVVNETRFQFMRINDSQSPVSGAPSILVEGAFNGGGNNLGQLHDGQNRYELQDYVSLLLGDHLLRVGGRLRSTQDGNTSTAGYNGQFLFPSIGAYEITLQGIADGLTPEQIRAAGGGASQFSLTTGNPRLAINVADFGGYLEDEWKLNPGMTLTPGVRYETQTGIPDHADFAPRLSYAWALGTGRDSTGRDKAAIVFRAGIGMFYQRFPTDLILNARRQNGIRELQYVVNAPDFYPNLPPAAPAGSATLPTFFRISPRLHAPYLTQTSVGVDKQLFNKLSLSLDYSYLRSADQLLTRNVNAPLPGTYNPEDPSSGTRPLGIFENIYEYGSEGISKRNELYANFRWRTKSVILYGSYLFSHTNSDTAGATSFPSNQYNLHLDYGRDASDIRHRAYLGGLVNLPHRFQINPFLVLQSSMPFNITIGEDLNGDSQFNDRPAFATDLNRPSVYRTRWGNFDAAPQPGQTIIPINYGRGPSLEILNLQLSRSIGFGPRLPDQPAAPPARAGGRPAKTEIARRYQLLLGLVGQNIFNTVNGGPPVGVLGSPLFGQSTNLATTQFTNPQANRILYLNLRLDF